MSDFDRRARLEAFLRNRNAARLNANVPERRSLSSRFLLVIKNNIVPALLIAVLLPENIRSLIENLDELGTKFLEYRLDPSGWNSVYFSNVEGIVNQRELRLSGTYDVMMMFEIDQDRRTVSAFIESLEICALGLPYPQLLLHGRLDFVSPDSLTLYAYDFVGGDLVDRGKVEVTRYGNVIEVTGLERVYSAPIRLVAADLSMGNHKSIACG